MPNSLNCMIKKLAYKGKISNEKQEELLYKLKGHDREIYNKAIDDFIKGIVNYSQKNLTDHLEFVVTLSDLEEIANKLRGDTE